MFCESVRRQRPLSFFGNGQSVPEDLEPVSKRPIIDALVRQLPLTRRAVA
jgi:flagellar biosynthesis GTPase FlhF